MGLDQVSDAGLPDDVLLVAVEALELDDVAEVHLKWVAVKVESLYYKFDISFNISHSHQDPIL